MPSTSTAPRRTLTDVLADSLVKAGYAKDNALDALEQTENNLHEAKELLEAKRVQQQQHGQQNDVGAAATAKSHDNITLSDKRSPAGNTGMTSQLNSYSAGKPADLGHSQTSGADDATEGKKNSTLPVENETEAVRYKRAQEETGGDIMVVAMGSPKSLSKGRKRPVDGPQEAFSGGKCQRLVDSVMATKMDTPETDEKMVEMPFKHHERKQACAIASNNNPSQTSVIHANSRPQGKQTSTNNKNVLDKTPKHSPAMAKTTPAPQEVPLQRRHVATTSTTPTAKAGVAATITPSGQSAHGFALQPSTASGAQSNRCHTSSTSSGGPKNGINASNWSKLFSARDKSGSPTNNTQRRSGVESSDAAAGATNTATHISTSATTTEMAIAAVTPSVETHKASTVTAMHSDTPHSRRRNGNGPLLDARKQQIPIPTAPKSSSSLVKAPDSQCMGVVFAYQQQQPSGELCAAGSLNCIDLRLLDAALNIRQWPLVVSPHQIISWLQQQQLDLHRKLGIVGSKCTSAFDLLEQLGTVQAAKLQQLLSSPSLSDTDLMTPTQQWLFANGLSYHESIKTTNKDASSSVPRKQSGENRPADLQTGVASFPTSVSLSDCASLQASTVLCTSTKPSSEMNQKWQIIKQLRCPLSFLQAVPIMHFNELPNLAEIMLALQLACGLRHTYHGPYSTQAITFSVSGSEGDSLMKNVLTYIYLRFAVRTGPIPQTSMDSIPEEDSDCFVNLLNLLGVPTETMLFYKIVKENNPRSRRKRRGVSGSKSATQYVILQQGSLSAFFENINTSRPTPTKGVTKWLVIKHLLQLYKAGTTADYMDMAKASSIKELTGSKTQACVDANVKPRQSSHLNITERGNKVSPAPKAKTIAAVVEQLKSDELIGWMLGECKRSQKGAVDVRRYFQKKHQDGDRTKGWLRTGKDSIGTKGLAVDEKTEVQALYSALKFGYNDGMIACIAHAWGVHRSTISNVLCPRIRGKKVNPAPKAKTIVTSSLSDAKTKTAAAGRSRGTTPASTHGSTKSELPGRAATIPDQQVDPQCELPTEITTQWILDECQKGKHGALMALRCLEKKFKAGEKTKGWLIAGREGAGQRKQISSDDKNELTLLYSALLASGKNCVATCLAHAWGINRATIYRVVNPRLGSLAGNESSSNHTKIAKSSVSSSVKMPEAEISKSSVSSSVKMPEAVGAIPANETSSNSILGANGSNSLKKIPAASTNSVRAESPKIKLSVKGFTSLKSPKAAVSRSSTGFPARSGVEESDTSNETPHFLAQTASVATPKVPNPAGVNGSSHLIPIAPSPAAVSRPGNHIQVSSISGRSVYYPQLVAIAENFSGHQCAYWLLGQCKRGIECTMDVLEYLKEKMDADDSTKGWLRAGKEQSAFPTIPLKDKQAMLILHSALKFSGDKSLTPCLAHAFGVHINVASQILIDHLKALEKGSIEWFLHECSKMRNGAWVALQYLQERWREGACTYGFLRKAPGLAFLIEVERKDILQLYNALQVGDNNALTIRCCLAHAWATTEYAIGELVRWHGFHGSGK